MLTKILWRVCSKACRLLLYVSKYKMEINQIQYSSRWEKKRVLNQSTRNHYSNIGSDLNILWGQTKLPSTTGFLMSIWFVTRWLATDLICVTQCLAGVCTHLREFRPGVAMRRWFPRFYKPSPWWSTGGNNGRSQGSLCWNTRSTSALPLKRDKNCSLMQFQIFQWIPTLALLMSQGMIRRLKVTKQPKGRLSVLWSSITLERMHFCSKVLKQHHNLVQICPKLR